MAKPAVKSAGKRAGKKSAGKKARKGKGKRSFATYIRRALGQVNKDLTLSGKSMAILNSFVNDYFDRIATEAAALARASKRTTLGSREVQTAVRLLLPAELAKHAMAEGARAVAKLATA
jgi:histone H2B